MQRVSFYLLLGLAVIYALLNVVEAWQYDTWETTLRQQKVEQAQLAFAQRQDAFNQELLKRLALESQADTAIAEMLKRHHVRVIFSGAKVLEPAPAPPSDSTGPMMPGKTPETPGPSPVNP